jgi:hypothetical protein
MGDRDWHALLDAHDAVVRAHARQAKYEEFPLPVGSPLANGLACN